MAEPGPQSAGRIMAIAGGKGGVGKTLVAANLSLLLARTGKRVLAVDGDLGGANLHTVLGVEPPQGTLSDVLFRGAKLSEVATDTRVPNLRIVTGAHDDAQAANPKHNEKMRLIRHLRDARHDVVVIDLGAGTAFNTLDLFLTADDGILVVVPEPTSVENAYRFLKAAFLRRLKLAERSIGVDDLIARAVAGSGRAALRTPRDIIRAIAAHDRDAGRAVEEQLASFRPRLILNQVHDVDASEERGVADDMASASRRFFGIHMEVLGVLPDDVEVRRALRARTPVVEIAPQARFSTALRDVVLRLWGEPREAGRAA